MQERRVAGNERRRKGEMLIRKETEKEIGRNGERQERKNTGKGGCKK